MSKKTGCDGSFKDFCKQENVQAPHPGSLPENLRRAYKAFAVNWSEKKSVSA